MTSRISSLVVIALVMTAGPATATGGRTLYPRTLADVVSLYDAIGRDPGYSYSLGYTSANSASGDKPRKIEVRVRSDRLAVTQSRDSYTR